MANINLHSPSQRRISCILKGGELKNKLNITEQENGKLDIDITWVENARMTLTELKNGRFKVEVKAVVIDPTTKKAVGKTREEFEVDEIHFVNCKIPITISEDELFRLAEKHYPRNFKLGKLDETLKVKG